MEKEGKDDLVVVGGFSSCSAKQEFYQGGFTSAGFALYPEEAVMLNKLGRISPLSILRVL